MIFFFFFYYFKIWSSLWIWLKEEKLGKNHRNFFIISFEITYYCSFMDQWRHQWCFLKPKIIVLLHLPLRVRRVVASWTFTKLSLFLYLPVRAREGVRNGGVVFWTLNTPNKMGSLILQYLRKHIIFTTITWFYLAMHARMQVKNFI